MAILETLYILFSGDASQLEKENANVVASNARVDQSFKKTSEASTQLHRALLRLTRQFGLFFLARKAIQEVGETSSYILKLNLASQALGVNIETLDAWSEAVKRTGGTAEGFQGSLKSLADHLGTTTKDALKLLPQYADAFKKLGPTQAMSYGKALGLDEATILLLQKGRREVDSIITRQKELGVITKKDGEVFSQFNNELQDTGHAFRSIFTPIAELAIPILEKLFDVFAKGAAFLRRHVDVLKGSLIALAVVAGILALPFLAANSVFLLTAAGIGVLTVAIGLAYDDFKTFMRGGDSLIGRAEKRWPEAFKRIRESLEFLKKSFKWLVGGGDESVKELRNAAERLRGNETNDLLSQGQKALQVASVSPLNYRTFANSYNNSSKDKSIQIGEITINTQATDAEGISKTFSENLTRQLRQLISNQDDGVHA